MGYFDDLIPKGTATASRGFFNDLIPEKTPEPEPVGAVRGFFGALQRGVKQIGDLPDTIDLTNKAGLKDNSYRAHRIGQLEGISGPEVVYNNQRAAAERVIQNQVEQDAVPRSAAQQRLDKAEGWKAKFAAWLRDPVELTASIAAESLPASIAGAAAGGIVGGPPGMIAGVGLSSGLMTFSSELLGNAAARGVDLRDPKAMTDWVRSPAYDEDATRALTKSVVIGAIDSATAATAGRFIVPALKTGLAKNVALATAKEVGMQAAAGAGGEALGSKAAGQEIDPFNVFAEAIAEVAGAPSEVVGNFRARNKGLRARYDSKAADAARVVQLIERPVTSTVRDAETGQPMNVTAPQAIEPEFTKGGGQSEKEVRQEEVLTPAGTPEQPAAPTIDPQLNDLRAQAAKILVEQRNFHPEDAAKYAVRLGGKKELEGFITDNPPPPTGTPAASSEQTSSVPAVAGAVAANAAEAPVVEEPQNAVPESRQLAEPKVESDPIVQAAIRNGGKVYTGPFHSAIEAAHKLRGKSEDGFVTKSGKFLTRDEAYEHAVANKQFPPNAEKYIEADALARVSDEFKSGVAPKVESAPANVGSPTANVGSGTQHHVAEYGGKSVVIDYVADKKREFKVAAQRVSDNLKPGEKGYVTAPDGKRYEISWGTKSAKLVTPETTAPVAPKKRGKKTLRDTYRAPAESPAQVTEDVIDESKPKGGVPYYRKLGEDDALDLSRKRMRSVPQNYKLAYIDGWYAGKKSAPNSPAQATEKMQAQVSTVAKTEGTRPAKEIKSELVQRLEEALAKAPTREEFNAQAQPVGVLKSEWEKSRKLTINIPGDGEFKMANNKEAIGEVLKRAQKISTYTAVSKPARRDFQKNNFKTLEFTDWTDPAVVPALEKAAKTNPKLLGVLEDARKLAEPTEGTQSSVASGTDQSKVAPSNESTQTSGTQMDGGNVQRDRIESSPESEEGSEFRLRGEMSVEAMAEDLRASGKVLRGSQSEIARALPLARRAIERNSQRGEKTLRAMPKRSLRDLYPRSETDSGQVSQDTRVFVQGTSETQVPALRRNINILAHGILFGSDKKVGTESILSGFDFIQSLAADRINGLRIVFEPFLKDAPRADYIPRGKGEDYDILRVNLKALSKEDLTNQQHLDVWVSSLIEEVLHSVTFRVSSAEELKAVWNSLSPQEQAQTKEVYKKDMQRADYWGAEYVRMILQDRLFGHTTEMKKLSLTDEVKAHLRRLVDKIKSIFGAKPKNDIARQIVERIEGAIKGEAPIEQSIFDGGTESIGASPDKPIADILQKGDREDAGDDYIPTEVFGIKDNILDKARFTDAERAKSQAIAQAAFEQAGLAVTRDDDGHFQLVDTGKKDNAAGRRLVEGLKQEIKTYGQGSLEVTELVQSIVLDFKTGRMDALFDKPVRNALYALAQGERSFRGVSLNALRGAGEDIRFVAQNIDVHLQRVWHERYGGEHIDAVLERIREKFKAFFTPEVVKGIANSLGKPVTESIVKQGLDTNFSNLGELRDTYTSLLTKAGVEEKAALTLARQIIDALRPRIRLAGEQAVQGVEQGLTADEKIVLRGGKKPLWLKIVEAVQRGEFDNGPLLREQARANGWKPPTDEQVARIKRLAERERNLANLTQKEIAAAGGDKGKLNREKIVREQATLPSRVPLMRQMEAEWTTITKPVNFRPWRWFGKYRANNAAFINELISANLLLRLSFAPKQALSVMSQFAFHIPTRAVGQAIELHAQTKALRDKNKGIGNQTALATDIYNTLAGALKSARAGFKDAVSQFVAALKGRGEARNIDRLMSGIAALERIEAKAKQYKEEGKTAQAIMMQMLGFLKTGYRIAQAFDNLHGVPSEYIEMRHQAVMGLMKNGVERAAANAQADNIIESVKASHIQAIAQAKAILDEMGEEASPEKIREISYRIARGWAYENIRDLGLAADDFQASNKQLREVIGWNENEVGMNRGVGGFVGAGVRGAGKVAENLGVPLAIGQFSNAIAIGINRALHFTPLGFFPGAFGGEDNAWFQTEMDRNQRKVEASIGTVIGSLAVALALSGAIVVRLRWPRDPEERDLFEAQGHRPNTLEIPHDDGTFTAISLNTGMAQFLAPYLAAGGALRDLIDEREKKQAKLNADAAKKGLPPEKIRPISTADMIGVAASAGYQTILGGRTSGGAVASMLDYGTPNVTKIVAGQVAPIVPLLPAMQEISRMGGVVLDSKLATFTDFLLPLPSSPARRVNFLGDPSGTPDETQRIVQILTGGTYPIVDPSQAKELNAYKVLFASGYKPPSINPNQGHAIGNSFRPFTDAELERYAVARGQEFKAALGDLPADADLKTVRAAYRSANARALGKMGVAGARPKKSAKSKIRGLRSRFKSPRSTFRKRRNSLRFSYAR